VSVAASTTLDRIGIHIGGIAIDVRTSDLEFQDMLRARYGAFVGGAATAEFELAVELCQPESSDPDEDVKVWCRDGLWFMRRGDFRAEWNPAEGRGWVRQTANPYSIDAVLRILHSLILARQGGFLLHAAGAIRNRKAFLFSGISGAGKTTISRLAPADVTLLTDEISYVRREPAVYRAYGTPFAGELAKIGENVSAPLEAVYFLVQGPENRIEPVDPADAVGMLLRNILFFAHEPELVRTVFRNACEFAARVRMERLVFVPDARVWELIG
jgi:hypothetical protein